MLFIYNLPAMVNKDFQNHRRLSTGASPHGPHWGLSSPDPKVQKIP